MASKKYFDQLEKTLENNNFYQIQTENKRQFESNPLIFLVTSDQCDKQEILSFTLTMPRTLRKYKDDRNGFLRKYYTDPKISYQNVRRRIALPTNAFYYQVSKNLTITDNFTPRNSQ